MNITQDQVLSVVRWLIATVGGYVVGKGWLSSEQIVLITGVAVAVVPLVWSLFAHTQANQVRAVTAMPGVDKIIVNELANPTLKGLAESQAPEDVKVEPSKITLMPKGKTP